MIAGRRFNANLLLSDGTTSQPQATTQSHCNSSIRSGRTHPDPSTPAPAHRSPPSEVWEPVSACTSLLSVSENRSQFHYRVVRYMLPQRSSVRRSELRTGVSLPLFQLH